MNPVLIDLPEPEPRARHIEKSTTYWLCYTYVDPFTGQREQVWNEDYASMEDAQRAQQLILALYGNNATVYVLTEERRSEPRNAWDKILCSSVFDDG